MEGRETTKQPENEKGCIQEAERLQAENAGQGEVWYVAETDEGRICHAYYLPDPSNREGIALNQADNGFQRYPGFKVGEVLDHGFRLPQGVSASKLIGLIQDHYFDHH